ncbi:MAG: hypothetical protein ACLU8S_04620 [Coprococcus phoceensis]
MAYFLKKTNNKKGTYLQIYESYYNPERKTQCHLVKTLSRQPLAEQGI